MGRFKVFQQELHRRRIYRAATIYLVVAWGATEIVTFLLERLPFPDWSISVVAIAFVVGFPIAMVLAWHFDITTDGVQPTLPGSTKGGVTIVLAIGLLLGGTAGLFYLIYPDGHMTEVETVVIDEFSPPEQSIAVLPFMDLSRDGDQEYLANGLAEIMLHQLAQMPDLHVIARTSSFAFKEQNLGVAYIGRQLNVGTVLEGSVQKAGNTLRITAQLIDTRSDTHIWSKSFDRPETDIFSIQDEVAAAVARELHETLETSGTFSSADQFTENVAAYDLYLLGRHQWHQRTENSLLKSIKLFKEAIDLDPEFALAYTALADAYGVLPGYSNTPFDDVVELADAAVRRAFELDPELPEAYASSGLLRLQQGRLEETDRDLEQAISLAPNNTMAHMWYGRSLFLQDRYLQAIPMLQTARRLDPLLAVVSRQLAIAYFWTGDFDESGNEFRRALQLAPEYTHTYNGLANVNVMIGNFADAIRDLRRALELAPDDSLIRRELAWTYIGIGYDAEANELLSRAEASDPDDVFTIFGRKLYFLETGQVEDFVAYTQGNLAGQPDNRFRIADAALANALAGNFADAVDLYDQLEPRERQFSQPLFDKWDFLYGYSHALTLIKAYQMTGKDDEADVLATMVDEYLERAAERGLSLPNRAYFLSSLNAMRGFDDLAISNLQHAYDSGWRGFRVARRNPALQSLHDDERFLSILSRAELDLIEARNRLDASQLGATQPAPATSN